MEIKDKSAAASCFVFSLPKAGSTLANALVRDLGAEVGMTYRSIMDEYFAKGIVDSDIPLDVGQSLEANGYVYGGFRYLPPGLDIPFLEASRKIFLVRDPRDMLVSWFFSSRQSHILPGIASEVESSELKKRFIEEREKAQQLEINDWVMQKTRGIVELLLSYDSVLRNPLTKIYRYEDVIFDKSAWAADIAKHFGWDITAARCSEISQRHDIRVGVEDPSRHIRNVTPGDFKNKLSAETISELNYHLRPFLEAFRYADISEYYLDTLELFKKQRVVGVLMNAVSADIIADIKSLPLSENRNSTLIDDRSVECIGYWLEELNAGADGLKTDVPFLICYVLRFHQPVADVVLGASVFHSGTEEQFGRNTMEFGPLSFKAGSCILLKWHFSGLPYAGEYLASVGMSSHTTGAFCFRQYRMRSFSLSKSI